MAHPLGLAAFLEQTFQGLALQIGGIEDRHRPVAHPAAGSPCGFLASTPTPGRGKRISRRPLGQLAFSPLVHLGPQHMHGLAALAGKDPQRPGLGKAAPIRQG